VEQRPGFYHKIVLGGRTLQGTTFVGESRNEGLYPQLT
jgi:hypothetical protein